MVEGDSNLIEVVVSVLPLKSNLQPPLSESVLTVMFASSITVVEDDAFMVKLSVLEREVGVVGAKPPVDQLPGFVKLLSIAPVQE